MYIPIFKTVINGELAAAVSSLQVAAHFGKKHSHIMRDIRDILKSDEDRFGRLNFQPSSYLSEQNKEMPMYVMNKAGFALLVRKYTEPETIQMKERYMARFNEVEESIFGQRTLSALELLLPTFTIWDMQERKNVNDK